MRFVRTAARALLASWLVLGVGCDGGGRLGTLSFEVSAPSEGGCLPDALPAIGSDSPCTVLRLYRRRVDGSLEAVPLYRGSADHSAGAQGALELRFDSSRIAFDARLAEGERHDLLITVYTSRPWAPAYGARLDDVRLDQAQIRVRLHPFREWACPGRVIDPDETLEARALHRAVLVGNGDVLLLGGVQGEGISPAGVGRPGFTGAILQPVVEVFEGDEHRFRRVEVIGGSLGGFARVLFDAYYVGVDADGRHRIRVFGGLQLPAGREGTAVLAFDNTGVLTPIGAPALGAPFAPSPEAEAAPSVDLLYDAERWTLQVTAPLVDPTGGARGAAITVSAPLADGMRALLMGLAGTGEGWLPASQYYAVDGPTGPLELVHQRLGAALEPIPSHDRFFVWGGNLSTTPRVAETAGELLVPGGGLTAISALGLPPPVAFHTMTRVSDDVVIVAGGLRVEESGFLRATRAPDPIVALQVVDALTVVAHEVSDVGYAPSILHTATFVPGWGVVLTGGATVDAAGDRLVPVGAVGRVHGDIGSFAYEGDLQDLAQPRFGHAATLLSGERLLVTGGFERTDEGLRALSLAELMLLSEAPYPRIADAQCVDQSAGLDGGVDAGPRLDAGLDGGLDGSLDAAPPDADASAPDGAPPGG